MPKAAVSVPHLDEGGIISGANWAGGSTPFIFLSIRYMASANCSAFNFPIPFISHRPLKKMGITLSSA